MHDRCTMTAVAGWVRTALMLVASGFAHDAAAATCRAQPLDVHATAQTSEATPCIVGVDFPAASRDGVATAESGDSDRSAGGSPGHWSDAGAGPLAGGPSVARGLPTAIGLYAMSAIAPSAESATRPSVGTLDFHGGGDDDDRDHDRKPRATPLPASAWLLLSSLAGLMAVGRRQPA